jgi:hypothetical protein
MSSQGLNSTYLNANTDYRYTPPAVSDVPGVGIPAGIYATQFASDYTKRIKEAAMYREYNGTAPAGAGSTTPYNNAFIVPVNYSIVQSNQNRKTYQFGEAVCTSGCTGAFPSNPLGS